MKQFYRIGEKLSQIEICGNDIKQYSIVIHSNRNLAAPTDAPDWIIKAANIMQTYIYKLTDTFIPIYYDIYPVPTPKEILIGGTIKEYDPYKDEKFADDEYAFKVVDGNVVTGKSAGWAFDLGLKLISLLLGDDKAEKVRASIYYKD